MSDTKNGVTLSRGCAWDSVLIAEHGDVVAALLRVARRMRQSCHDLHVGGARRRLAGCSARLIRENVDLAEAMCHAEQRIRDEVRAITGVQPVDDQPAPTWPADVRAALDARQAGNGADTELALFSPGDVA